MNNPRRIQRHLVKALAAGALLAAAALPMAIASAAGATTPTTYAVVFSTSGANNTAPGDSGTFTLTASAATFAGDGGNATITSSNAGVTFSNVVDADTSQELITGDYAVAATATQGDATLTITDDAGTFTATNAIVVDALPAFTSVSPTSAVDLASPSPTEVTVTGANFASGATVTFTNTTNGTTLASADSASGAFTGGIVSSTAPHAQGSSTYVSATSLTVNVDPTNSVTGGPATTGSYTVTVTNPDGGSVTSGAVYTISGNEISEVTPSAVGVVSATASSTPITVSGSGFSSTATLALDSTCVTDGVTLGTEGAPTGNSITDTLDVSATAATAAAALPFQCSLTVDNVSPGNGATYTSTDVIGIGEASAIAPTITASSLSSATAIEPGTSPQAITFTGTGFSQFTSPVETLVGTSTTPDASASIGTTAASCLGGQSGTTLTCELTVSSGAASGAHSVVLENTSKTAAFPAAFSVAGPAITSAAPTELAVGAPVGTVVTLTGTGFGPTTTGSDAADTTAGTAPTVEFQNVSATQEDMVVISPVTATWTGAITVSSYDAFGDSSTSAPFAYSVGAPPSVLSTTYKTGTTGVGVGATGQAITVTGSNFATGVTIGGFVNAAGVADPDVTATVTAVNTAGTQITATIAVAAGDTNTIDGFTVTNTNGGAAKATAAVPAGLVLDAAPTITGVSPSTGNASATNAFTITGTGFVSGAVVTPSSDGTCGTSTVASSTSITVSCTLGAEGSSAVTLDVTNPDGGQAVSATVLPAATTTPPAPKFHVSAVHGSAVAGKTVTLTISGTGFYGQPKITSNAAGTKAVVTKDTGKSLTVRVTTKAGVSGEHTFTVKLANGKSGKVNYSVKK